LNRWKNSLVIYWIYMALVMIGGHNYIQLNH
jgi:hypothetical protein